MELNELDRGWCGVVDVFNIIFGAFLLVVSCTIPSLLLLCPLLSCLCLV
jgi:hypothetical protein